MRQSGLGVRSCISPLQSPDFPLSRPLRVEFPNAIYQVTSRGDCRQETYRDDMDRQAQLDVLAHAMDRFDAEVLAYCQMGNHSHLVLHTRQANL
jgi:putative transposase